MFKNPAIAYVRDRGTLCICDAAGLFHAEVLQSSGNMKISAPAWSPNGEQIAFLEQANAGTDLCIVNADGSGCWTLHSFSESNGEVIPSFFSWLPDGTGLVLRSRISPHKIFVFSIARDELTECALPTQGLDYAEDRFALSPNFSPDEAGFHGLLVLSAYPRGFQPDIEGDIYTVEIAWEPNRLFEIYNPQQFTFTADLVEQEPAFSRDGIWISYNRHRPGTNDWTTVVTAYPTQGVSSVIGQCKNVTWSPDGCWLAFQRESGRLADGSLAYDIYRTTPDGSDLSLLSLAYPGDKSMPNWNPAWINEIDP